MSDVTIRRLERELARSGQTGQFLEFLVGSLRDEARREFLEQLVKGMGTHDLAVFVGFVVNRRLELEASARDLSRLNEADLALRVPESEDQGLHTVADIRLWIERFQDAVACLQSTEFKDPETNERIDRDMAELHRRRDALEVRLKTKARLKTRSDELDAPLRPATAANNADGHPGEAWQGGNE